MILWAMRESVNETTGITTFEATYGHLPHGPLAALKEIWVNEDRFSVPRNQSTVQFLKDLRDRLEMARSYAKSHAEKAQQRYVERYNRRSCYKSFTVGRYCNCPIVVDI